MSRSLKASNFILLLLCSLLLPILAACAGSSSPSANEAPTTASSGVATAAPAESTAPTAAAAPTESSAPATAAPEATAATSGSSGTAAQSPINDKSLVIGLNQPPDTLFGLESQSSATVQVLFGVGSCSTNMNYDYQPTYCFANNQFPTLENGGVVSSTVQVDASKVSATNPIVISGNLITDTKALSGTEVPKSLVQLKITNKLNPALKWEDGTPVTSADALEAYKIQKDPALQSASRYVIDRIVSVEAPDAETVVTTMAPGYLDFDYYVATFVGFLNSAKYKDMTLDQVRQAESQHPMSFGPYMVKENVANEQTTLVSNPYFPTQPKIGTIIYKYVTDADQLIAQLESGEVDLLDPIVLNLGEFPKLDELQKSGKISTQYVPATVWEHIDFGIQRADGQPAFFDDVKVRQAVAYGINRKDIIDKVLYGKTTVMNTYVPQDHPSFPKSGLEAYDFDANKAKQLLDEAGWKAGSDGIRAKDGRKFSITLFTTEGNPTRQSVAEVIQQNLKDIGIDMKLQLVPGPAVLFKNGADGTLSGRRFDLAMYAWVSGVDPSHTLYTCDQIPTADNGWAGQNNPGYCNKDFDAATRVALTELDKTKRIADDAKPETIWNKDLPAFPLYQRVDIVAFNPAVQNVKLDPTSNVTLPNLGDIDITK